MKLIKSKDSTVNVVVTAILGNSIIGLAKFFGWFVTGSPSMLAEAIHSVADTSNQFLLFVGIKHGEKKATRDFPWGRSQARYIWNLISAVGIFFVGFGVTAYHGVSSLLADNPSPQNLNLVVVSVLVFAFLIEGYVFLMAFKEVNEKRGDKTFMEYFKTNDDPTAIAVLLEDGIAVLGVFIAFVGIGLSQILNTHWPDAVGAILIAILLGIMAIVLAFANTRLLLGSSAPEEDELEIKDFIESLSEVEKVIALKTHVVGPGKIKLSVEIEFHGGEFLDREQISRDAEKIKSGKEEPVQILVETAERMVRVIGNRINSLEAKLYEQFPSLIAIDLEVN
ncbi:cation diffusion facilitator family transporter [bacterium]|nr:cation diffusion facilitator family transporter [bacterium]